MKKIAYTLAEILITLTVVGVVAALTMPALISSSQNQKNAAALAVAVSDWENAMAAMMSADGATDLLETKAWTDLRNSSDELYGYSSDTVINNFTAELSKYLGITNYYKGFQTFYDGLYENWLNGDVIDDYSDGIYEEYVVYTTKKGPVYGVTTPSASGGNPKFSEEEILEAGGNLTEIAGEVKIDVNGKAKPNTYGRDIFLFTLGTDGMLYPRGGLDYSVYYYEDDSVTWKNSDDAYRQCTDISTSKGLGCTARLVENNFKMDY